MFFNDIQIQEAVDETRDLQQMLVERLAPKFERIGLVKAAEKLEQDGEADAARKLRALLEG